MDLSHCKTQLTVFPEQQQAVSEKLQTLYGLSSPVSGEKNTWLNDIADNEATFANEQSSAYGVIEITGKGTLALMQQLSFIDLQTSKPVVLTQLATD